MCGLACPRLVWDLCRSNPACPWAWGRLGHVPGLVLMCLHVGTALVLHWYRRYPTERRDAETLGLWVSALAGYE